MRFYKNGDGKKIKIGVKYYPGDSGGYYVVFNERMGEQDKLFITWSDMEVIFEEIKNKFNGK